MSPKKNDVGIDRIHDDRPACRLIAEQQMELTRRAAELTANPDIGLTWEQIRSEVGKRL